MSVGERRLSKNATELSRSAGKTLADWIASSRYPIHSRLPPERELASMLGLSRGKLREALRQLESEGVIWRHVGIGTYVGSRPASIHSSQEALSTSTTLAEILEARLSVEPIVARFAAVRAQPGEVVMIGRYFASGAASDSWADWENWASSSIALLPRPRETES
ncbi:GntR family transcriptional regulator [Bradyrhizobium sp. Arg237L]|uniref:FadR/GntR family transcriptional regulator n=1 Tax=Bradyrhizobium sp. Arg237L TaxID=3003352 RepID=UPI00249E0E25|nr:GntR family transcriptional regulator [Bradyrhizobium sp. Arg237L]MDI4234165.1 GntR family transcriptional regulator [Bradyrhizobium sp. Arg237L]